MTRRRSFLTAAATGLVASLLAACGQSVAPAGPGAGAAPPAAEGVPGQPAVQEPVALVGSWRLQATGEAEGTVLHLGDGLRVWRMCGVLDGQWRADTAGAFVGNVTGWSDACGAQGAGQGGAGQGGAQGRPPAWMAKAAAFRPEGSGFVLLDGGGSAVARLLPGGRVAPRADIEPALAEPPVADARLRAVLRPAKPVPAWLVPATKEKLAGRWVPAARADRPDAATAPHVRLGPDGTWSGSDGCNGLGGRWTAGPGGAVLATSGGQTMIGCENLDVGGWLTGAARAGFAGADLVLLDADGKETGRLARAAG